MIGFVTLVRSSLVLLSAEPFRGHCKLDCCPDRLLIRCPLHRVMISFPSHQRGNIAVSAPGAFHHDLAFFPSSRAVEQKMICRLEFLTTIAHAESSAPIRCREALSLLPPVRSCNSVAASSLSSMLTDRARERLAVLCPSSGSICLLALADRLDAGGPLLA